MTADVVQTADGQRQGNVACLVGDREVRRRRGSEKGLAPHSSSAGLTSYKMLRGRGGLGAEMVQGVVVGWMWVWMWVEVEVEVKLEVERRRDDAVPRLTVV